MQFHDLLAEATSRFDLGHWSWGLCNRAGAGEGAIQFAIVRDHGAVSYAAQKTIISHSGGVASLPAQEHLEACTYHSKVQQSTECPQAAYWRAPHRVYSARIGPITLSSRSDLRRDPGERPRRPCSASRRMEARQYIPGCIRKTGIAIECPPARLALPSQQPCLASALQQESRHQLALPAFAR